MDQQSSMHCKWKRRRRRLEISLGAALFLAPSLLHGYYASNPPLGLSGAPGEGTCSGCHSKASGTGSFSVVFPAMTYTPGGGAVSWTVHSPGGSGGFELSTRPPGNTQAGTLTAGTSSAVNSQSGIQYAVQTSPASSWAIQWTPPATNVGNVTVYVTGVDSSSQSYATSYTLTPAVVTPPSTTISASPSSLTFNYSGAALATQTFQVTSSGASTAFTTSAGTSSGGNWLSALPAGGNTPLGVTVTANPAGLAVGQYTGSITIAAPGATNTPQTVSVTLNVAATPPPPSPTLSVMPGTLTFTSSSTAPQSVQVTASDGSAHAFTTAVSTDTGGNWLAAKATPGTTPSSVAVSVNSAGLAGGTYTGHVTLTSTSFSNSPKVIGVTLTVGTAPPPPPGNPVPLTFSLHALDKQLDGTNYMMLSGRGSVDSSGKVTGSGRFTTYTVGANNTRHTVATGTWTAESVVSFTPVPTSSGESDDDHPSNSGGTLVLGINLVTTGASAEPATMTIVDTGTQNGVTLAITGGSSYVPMGMSHISISVGGSGGHETDN